MNPNNYPESSAQALSQKRKEKELVIVEYELNQVVDNKLKKLKGKDVSQSPVIPFGEVEEKDEVFAPNLSCSVGSHIKNKALEIYPCFKSAEINDQTIISLGLNSILDLSFDFPKGQNTLFDVVQWRWLKNKFPPKKYQIDQYDSVKVNLSPLLTSYKEERPRSYNWYKLYNTSKSLSQKYDVEENEEWDEEDFCLFFITSVLKLQKHHKYVFDDNFNKSEWDYLCKFWSPIMEKLFERSGLRLTWGDTTLSLDDIQSKNNMKVDLRILQDETVQRFNKETDTAVLEASKEDPGLLKYQSDHCKLMVESKNIIDMYIDKGHNVDNVDCLQICGLDLVILNLSLSAPGLYVANEVFFGSITNSLSRVEDMLKIAFNLLSFKRTVLSIKNKNQEEKTCFKQNTKNIKSEKYNQESEKKLFIGNKKSWTRGTWVANRDSETKIPPSPHNLTT
ncbi:hypothetical protein BD770DRAFT_395701 [Pilaira anomala]|nr:hypothetical protein BD770DRAFT_395701 [Pilaira anomala]